MSWKLIHPPKTELATRKLAKKFQEMVPAPSDRPLSERRCLVYQRVMKEGGFRPVDWASARCIETKTTYRVNGKHTSYVLNNWTDDAKYPEVYAVVHEFVCDTIDDGARLYSTFDSKIQARSTGDINRTFAYSIPEIAELGPSERFITMVVGALAYTKYLEKYVTVQPQDRAEVLFEEKEFFRWIYNLIGERLRDKNVHVSRLPVVAAIYQTYKKDKEAAGTFWRLVLTEESPSPDHPDRRLAKLLLSRDCNTGTAYLNIKNDGKRKDMTYRQFYVRCLDFWNAWRKGNKQPYFSKFEDVPDAI